MNFIRLILGEVIERSYFELRTNLSIKGAIKGLGKLLITLILDQNLQLNTPYKVAGLVIHFTELT